MSRISKFNSTLGRSYHVDPDDVLGAKGTLNQLGYYEVPSFGFTGYPDTPLFEGVERFQKDKGLQIDGIVKPNGPTERAMQRALQEKFLNANGVDGSGLTRQFDRYNDQSFYGANNRFAESFQCCATGTCDIQP